MNLLSQREHLWIPSGIDLTVHESSDETVDQKLTVHESSDETVEDWDLRTPIAPPMTSLEGAKVIFLTGTAQDKHFEGMS